MTTAIEQPRIRYGDRNGEIPYVVHDAEDAAAAKAAVQEEAPVTWGWLRLDDIQVDETGAAGVWLARAVYVRISRAVRPETGDATISFDTGGGTQHITASKETVAAYGPGANTTQCGKLIGIHDETVEGVDIVVPVYNWTETHYKDDADISDSYKTTLFNLTGRVNDDTFRNFSAGEVLFMGVSGAKRPEGDWELTFRFAASPNVTGEQIGDITGIAKGGWQYLWVLYKSKALPALSTTIPYPAAVYIERVYKPGDFDDLDIG